ncbi:hypothetical protein F4808DRAFT_418367 [Astrocystis sublimbata]|nr:hypothetical protein F4808DRAFT_418367 [Astrocystis sublimbata]
MSSSSDSQYSADENTPEQTLRIQRLLSDIHELVTKPYPKIALHPDETNIQRACLVLYPDNYPPLHLSIHFPSFYPEQPPRISIQTSINHPNVFGSYICATILNRDDGYTSAYTLKGIAIQILSFFDSDTLEQDYPGKVTLATFQDVSSSYMVDTYQCSKCEFGKPSSGKAKARRGPKTYDALVDHNPGAWPAVQSHGNSRDHPKNTGIHKSPTKTGTTVNTRRPGRSNVNIGTLPNEVLLLIIDYLEEFEHLTSFARAWPRISELVRDFDIVRKRELQCFCLKKDFQSAELGVGVKIDKGQITSEFDLLSKDAYQYLEVRRAVQSIRFDHWVPLPISRRHWHRVKNDLNQCLSQVAKGLRTPSPVDGASAHVIFTWMNDVVVRLNQDAEKLAQDRMKLGRFARAQEYHANKSTLEHASEKAINSYFHLFHMLVCWATTHPEIVHQANKQLRKFAAGQRSKEACPNLGHLLIALLISDVPVTDALIKSIITEAIVRNVVWLLDGRGAGLAELSYLERDAVSAYRLDKTFQGSRTSYRLLMFSELFRRTARPSHEKSLVQVREELFDRYGAPPRDAAPRLAAEVRRLHTVDDFPAFMREMGLAQVPTSANFTAVLRGTVVTSMQRGYSRMALPRHEAMRLRLAKDPDVLLTKEERVYALKVVDYKALKRSYHFFPDRRGAQDGGGHARRR